MKTIIHKANTRGHANHGWLNSYHTFSFAGYYNEERIHFGALRVLNDDTVAASMGFGKHPHDNMEIISIPLSGDLEHQDTTGRHEIIKQGDVQIMSAGSGIAHSEKNANRDKPVSFLQIWVLPKERNIIPRYEQKSFPLNERVNSLKTVVAPNHPEALWINQNAWFTLGYFAEKQSVNYALNQSGNGVYVFIIKGNITINNVEANERDGVGFTEIEELQIQTEPGAEFLIMEVPLLLHQKN
jgi:redox-sensitive bicupin YhaK (pirin superfamily)